MFGLRSKTTLEDAARLLHRDKELHSELSQLRNALRATYQTGPTIEEAGDGYGDAEYVAQVEINKKGFTEELPVAVFRDGEWDIMVDQYF